MVVKLSAKTHGIVKDIRALLSDRSKWTTGTFARNDQGRVVGARSEEAVCWCLVGAFEKVTNHGTNNFEFNEFEKNFPNRYVAAWNDQHNYEDVRDMLDALIENGAKI